MLNYSRHAFTFKMGSGGYIVESFVLLKIQNGCCNLFPAPLVFSVD